jgi:hypothetical protein
VVRGQTLCSHPRGKVSNIDCRASDAHGRPLDMQVTRLAPPGLWQSVKGDKEVVGESTIDEAVDLVRRAIEGKCNVAGKSKLHLVLDATQTPDLAFMQVANKFPTNE